MYDAFHLILYGAVLSASVSWLRGGEGRKRVLAPETPLPAQALSGLLLWAGLLFVVGAVNALVFRSFAIFQFTALPPGRMAGFLVFQLLVAVTEELLFRGCFTELGKSLRWHRAVIALTSAALFAMAHWIVQRDLIQLVTAFVIGLVFSVAYQRSERCSVWSLALAHFLYDIAIINVSAPR